MTDKQPTVPAESGSSGMQEESEGEPSTDVVVLSPFDQDPLVKHTTGLLGDSSRRSPANIDREWMAATVQHYFEDLRSTRSEVKELRRDLDDSRSDKGALESRIAVLTERIRNYARLRRTTHIFTAIGAGLVVLGIDRWSKADPTFSVLAIVVGALTVGLSLWMLPNGDDR